MHEARDREDERHGDMRSCRLRTQLNEFKSQYTEYKQVLLCCHRVLMVPRRSANTNSNVCGVIVTVKAVGGSGWLVDSMSTEGSMVLIVRRRWSSR